MIFGLGTKLKLPAKQRVVNSFISINMRNMSSAKNRATEKLMCIIDSVSPLICENLASPITVSSRQAHETAHPAMLITSNIVLCTFGIKLSSLVISMLKLVRWFVWHITYLSVSRIFVRPWETDLKRFMTSMIIVILVCTLS